MNKINKKYTKDKKEIINNLTIEECINLTFYSPLHNLAFISDILNLTKKTNKKRKVNL